MRIRLEFPLRSVRTSLIQIQDRLKKERPRVLAGIGHEIKDLATQDYKRLSSGGSGSGGQQWKSLDVGTFESAARRKTAAKRLVSQRRALASQIRLTKGKGAGAKRAALRKQRNALMTRLRALFATEATKHKPGIDTGAQSRSAGYSDAIRQKVNSSESSVTVGFRRKYSSAFDDDRQLLPANPPAAWMNACDRILESWADRVARTELQ